MDDQAEQAQPEQGQAEQAKIRTVVGRVVSDKMNKTRTVLVERQVKHPIYKKYVRRSKKVHVHDENNDSHVGDTVSIVETRPLSRTKSFRLHEILERAR